MKKGWRGGLIHADVLQNPGLQISKLKVEVQSGWVRLRGIVHSEKRKSRACTTVPEDNWRPTGGERNCRSAEVRCEGALV